MAQGTELLRSAPRPKGPPFFPAIATPILAQKGALEGAPDPRGDTDDGFGRSMAVDGETLVIGVPGRQHSANRNGVVYIFSWDGAAWIQQALLPPPPSSDPVSFATSVAISGDTIVVGAGPRYSYGGRAFVFNRSVAGWILQASLQPPDTAVGDAFGWSVAIDGNTAIVGAPDANSPSAYESGAAYVFTRAGTNWSQQQKIPFPGVVDDTEFGAAVALTGDTAIIGAPSRSSGGITGSGSGFVFVRLGSAWLLKQELTPTPVQQNAHFGSAVAVSGGVAVVGAPQQTTDGSLFPAGAGFAFALVGSSWSQVAVLGTPYTGTGGRYGQAVAISGTTAVVAGSDSVLTFRSNAGSWALEQSLDSTLPFDSQFGQTVATAGDRVFIGAPGFDDCGVVLGYKRGAGGAWSLAHRLEDTGSTAGDRFGLAIAASGDTMVVGSPFDTTSAARRGGSVSIFVSSGGVWSLQKKLLPPDALDHFGNGVALSGDVLAVATHWSYPGYIYVYRRTGTDWNLEQRLDPPPGTDGFGSSLSLDGNTLLEGSGYVYVHRAGTWGLQQRLVTAGPLGGRVDLAGDTAVVAAYGDDTRLAVVFRRSGDHWSQSQVLERTATGERQVGSIRLRGSELVIGMPEAWFPEAGSSGAAYVFGDAAGTFALTQKIFPPDATSSPGFGASADLQNDVLVIGAPLDSSSFPTSEIGSARVFARSGQGWVPQLKLVVRDTGDPLTVGTTVAAVQGQILVGHPDADTNGGRDSGTVYVFGAGTSDLTLSMTGSPSAVTQGDFVSFEVSLRNDGPDAAVGPRVTFDPQPGMALASAQSTQATCLRSNATETCTFGILPPGSTASARMVAVAMSAGSVATTSTLVPGGQTAQAVTTVAPGAADVSVQKSTSTFALAGSEMRYTVVLSNNGPGDAAGVLISDPTPPGLSWLGADGNCSGGFPCLIPRLGMGFLSSVSVRYLVSPSYRGSDPLVNVVTVATATADPDLSNNSARVESPIFAPAANLKFYTITPCRLVDTREVAMGGPDPLPPGPRSFAASRPGCSADSEAQALAVNVTVTQPSSAGYLVLSPAGVSIPNSSYVNYGAGQTRSNNGTLALRDGAFTIGVGQSMGSVHVIVDVVGYYR